jgi:hypothetical protein
MRDVSIGDAALGESATVIDPVVDWKLGPDREFGVPAQIPQLHVERCVCLTDAGRYGEVAPAALEIAVTGEAARERRAEVRSREIPAPLHSPDLAQSQQCGRVSARNPATRKPRRSAARGTALSSAGSSSRSAGRCSCPKKRRRSHCRGLLPMRFRNGLPPRARPARRLAAAADWFYTGAIA